MWERSCPCDAGPWPTVTSGIISSRTADRADSARSLPAEPSAVVFKMSDKSRSYRPMSMTRKLLAISLGLATVPGCGDVEWGGAEVRLTPPSERPTISAPVEEETSDTFPLTLPPPPEGPLLLVGEREGGRMRLEVVAEVKGDSLVPVAGEDESPGIGIVLARERLAPGSRWALFEEGVRVGSLVADSVTELVGGCTQLPGIVGVPMVTGAAQAATRLLALPLDAAIERPFAPYRPRQHNYDQRVASLNLASGLIGAAAVPWPRDGILSIRREIRSVSLRGLGSAPFLAATFALGDDVVTGPAAEGSYSIFLLGGQRADGTFYRAYSRLRETANGKAVTRYIDRIDLAEDGTDEILLEVLGEDSRWFALLSQRGGSWRTAFENGCPTVG